MFGRWYGLFFLITGIVLWIGGCATTAPERGSLEKADAVQSEPGIKSAARQGNGGKGSGEIKETAGPEPAANIPETVETPGMASGVKTAAQESDKVHGPVLMEESIINKPAGDDPKKADAPRIEPPVKTADQKRDAAKRPDEAEKMISRKPAGDRAKAPKLARRDPDAETEDLKAGIEKIRERLKLAAASPPQNDRNGKMAAIKALKIKVLYGSNKAAAKLMAKKLSGLGYNCNIIDKAPRSNFAATTIYFASRYEKEAKRLAAQLGGKTLFRPLTWPSAFHLIVATGR